MCRFADATDVTPYPVSHYERMIGASYPGLGHYWNEVSYGNINLTGSVVVGWYNLPHPKSSYILKDGDLYWYDLKNCSPIVRPPQMQMCSSLILMVTR